MQKIMLLTMVITSILFCAGCTEPIKLPENLEQLYDYNWMVVQEDSEPDVFRFNENGRLYIFNYSEDYNCKWSLDGDKITIRNIKRYNQPYTAEIYSENDKMYLKLGNILLEGSKLSK